MSLTTITAWDSVLPSMTIAVACFGALMVSASNIAKWRTVGLVVFLLIAACDSVDDLLLATGVYHEMPHLYGWSWPWPVLYGSALYLYVCSMTAPRFVGMTARKVLTFVTPAVIAVVLALPFYLQPVDVKFAFLDGSVETLAGASLPLTVSLSVLTGFFFTVNIFFIIAMFRRLSMHVDRVQDLFSNIEHQSLDWLRWVVLGSCAVLLVVLLASVQWWFLEPDDSWAGLDPLRLAIRLIWVASFAYFGARQGPVAVANGDEPGSEFITLENAEDQAGGFIARDIFVEQGSGYVAAIGCAGEVSKAKPATAYARSGLTEERMRNIAAKLRLLMQDTELYRDPQLCLRSLSTEIRVSENYVSETLNVYVGQKFFNFVNAYRIEASKHCLTVGNKSILTIANDVGFNSRSTFNEAFRKHTGMTPSAFRAQAKRIGLKCKFDGKAT